MKSIKIQRQIFSDKEKELTKKDYFNLLNAARDKGNEKLYCIIQVISNTGIRISELCYITVSAVKSGRANINCKGKLRQVFLSKELCKMLKKYISRNEIKYGPLFVTKSGNPLDRSNVWKMLKRLCKTAGVSQNRVFPHNLRHLFARTYYSIHKDIVRLADMLGHSNINTTRIYTMEAVYCKGG